MRSWQFADRARLPPAIPLNLSDTRPDQPICTAGWPQLGRMEIPMPTLGLIAFTALIAAQVLSVVYAARYGSAVPVRIDR